MDARVAEIAHKHALIRRYMEEHDIDGVVLSRRPNFAWLTAGCLNHVSTAADLGNASLLVRPDTIACVTSNIEAPRMLAEEIGPLGIEVHSFDWYSADNATAAWTDLIGGMKCACDAPTAGLPADVARLDAEFDTLRWSLTPGEIDRYRALARTVAAAVESSCREVQAGTTENALAGDVAFRLGRHGVRTPVLLMAADDRVSMFRHPLPTSRPFQRYGMAVCTGERHGLMVSVTRLFCFGLLPDDLLHRHAAVCRVDAALIVATRPGRALGEIFAVAQRTYAEQGFPDEWKHHHQGGSTGYVGREARATPDSRILVREHQAFAWNPSIAGTKSEDTILVGTNANQVLSSTGDWPCTPFEMAGTTWLRPDILQK